MADFLSAEWIAESVADRPALDPSISTLVQQVVTGGPDGSIAFTTTYESGRAVSAEVVPPPPKTAKPDPSIPVTLSLSYDDAQRVADGDLELGVAFMQGRLKADGDMKAILSLLQSAHAQRS